MPSLTLSTRGIAVGDVDNDGDPDIVVPSFDGRLGPNVILWNLYRHVDSPSPNHIGQSMVLDIYSAPGLGGVAPSGLLWLSLQRRSTPVSSPWGLFHLSPPILPLGSALPIPATTGKGSATLSIPFQRWLVGLQLHVQGGLLEGTPSQWRLSALITATVSR